jgi:hypothetical protein
VNTRRTLRVLALAAQSLAAIPASGQATGGAAPPAVVPSGDVASARELRLAVFTVPGKRSVTVSATDFRNATPSLKSVELVWRGADAGIRLRYETASTSGPVPAGNAITYLDGRFNLGGTRFNVEVGYLLRQEKFAATDTSTGLIRGGFRGDYRVGAAAGIVVGWSATYLRQPSPASGASSAEGVEGETSVLYAPPRYPVYVQLGYRRELMRFTGGSSPTPRNEELSMMFIGVGFQLGLR